MRIGIFRDRLDGFLERIDDSAAADFWRWYAAQLNRIVTRRKVRTRRQVTFIEVSREGWRLEGTDITATSSLSAMAQGMSPQRGDNGCAVVLAPDRFIKRRLSAVNLPRSRMAAIAELDISGSTPFTPTSMRMLFPESARAVGGTHCFLVKAEILSQIELELTRAGANSTAVCVRDGEDIVETDLRIQVRKPRSHQFTMLALLVGTSALLYAFLAIWLTAGATNRQLTAKAEQELANIQELRPAFEARRTEESRFAELRVLQSNFPSATAVLSELAQKLPDDSFLESVSWDGQSLIAGGFSRSAPQLIELLEQSPLFNNVAFAGPITKSPGNGGARFEIRMDIQQ